MIVQILSVLKRPIIIFTDLSK